MEQIALTRPDRQRAEGAFIAPPSSANSTPSVPATRLSVVANGIPNPATPDQQSALSKMGITQDRVANLRMGGVDFDKAQGMERTIKAGGQGGMVWNLKGYGDQNSVYAKASQPGGRINEFYGAGTGKESSPGSLRLNVMSSQGVMAPGSSTTGAVSAALKAAADRGDWGAVENFYAKQGQGFGGKTAEQIQGTDLKSQLAEVMSMPTNTFGQIAAKRARMAALNKGIQIADMESRNTLAASTHAMHMAKTAQDLEAGSLNLADQRRVFGIRDQLLTEEDPGKRADLVKKLGVLTGKGNDATGREIVQGDNGVFLVDRGTGAAMALQGIEPKKTEKLPGITADGMGGAYINTTSGIVKVDRKGEMSRMQLPGPQEQQPTQQSPKARFQSDPAMQGHTMGRVTAKGWEVYGPDGKLAGYWN